MFYTTEINIITHTTDDLEFKKRGNRKSLAIGFIVLIFLLGFFVIYHYPIQSEIGYTGVGFVSIISLFLLYWNWKYAEDWEILRFSKVDNKVIFSNDFIGEVTEITGLKIIEFEDYEDGSYYKLFVQVGTLPIEVMVDSEITKVKPIASAIANWCGVAFDYSSNQEKWDQQLADKEVEKFQKDKAHYLKHWNARSDPKLVEIYFNKEKYTAPLVAAVEEILQKREVK